MRSIAYVTADLLRERRDFKFPDRPTGDNNDNDNYDPLAKTNTNARARRLAVAAEAAPEERPERLRSAERMKAHSR